MNRLMYFRITGNGFIPEPEVQVKREMFAFAADWKAQVTELGTLYTCDAVPGQRNRFASEFFGEEIYNHCYLEIRENNKWDVIQALNRFEKESELSVYKRL